MSSSSTAQTSKNPTVPKVSAWSRGPPQSSSRSQSPAPSIPVVLTHSRRPSALSSIPITDGVSVNRINLGAAKQGSAVTFGSIDDISASISSSPATAPSIKSDVVKSFGSIDAERHETHVNGKPALLSRPSVAVPTPTTSSSAPSPAVSISSATKLAKPDIAKLFQNPSSVTSTQPSDTPSPSLHSSGLPSAQPASSIQPLPSSASSQPSQLGPQQHFIPYRHPQAGPVSATPRPAAWPTRQIVNGTGPRSQGAPNGTSSQISAAMSSPRLGPMPHNGQPPAMPPPPQMQPPPMPQQIWPSYYYDQSFYSPWYPPPHPHHHPPGGPHGPPHPGIPMSPRNPPMPLQQGGPGTPVLTHATASSIHPVHPPPSITHPSSSMSSISSPPPTPSATTSRLNANSSTFAPRAKVVIKKADGTEVNIENLKGSSSSPANNASTNGQASVFRQGSPSGTPARPSVRLESPEQRAQRLAEAERKVKEEEERKEKAEEERRRQEQERVQKLEEEEKERKRQAEEDEKERLRKEAEEERARKEAEEERLRKEEEKERLRREEEERERLRKEEEDRQQREEERRRKEEEERQRKEEERKQRVEEEERKQREEEERERLRKEEEEKERQRLEEEKAAQAKEAEEAAKAQAKEEGEITEEPESLDVISALKDDYKTKEPLRINTSEPLNEPLKKRPGHLDLGSTDSILHSIPSALTTARNIDDINNVQYPEGISSPRPELNTNAKDGKFRYDREFLMQFMAICKEKPETLPPLDAIGLEYDQPAFAMQRGGSARHRQASGGPSAPSRSGSNGLGLGPGSSGFVRSSNLNPFTNGGGMGNFSTQGSKMTSDERFQLAASRSSLAGGPASTQFGRPPVMQRTPSQGGIGRDRVRSQRGKTRDGGKMVAQQAASSLPVLPPESVVPLKVSENRWDRKAIQIDADLPDFVDRKVRGLLNKLTMERFDSISDQIIEWANKSEKEKDGRTLIQVIRLVFEKATDEAAWSEMYARLCRKMMEQISNKVQDDGIKNTEGKPIAGGQLFRKYLLNRCQEDFERGWVQKEATAAAAASKATEDEAIKAANEKNKENEDGEVALYSDEYYAAQKAKRQGLGLVKFIGELFKLQMLTERIMHECVKKLLGNVDNPEEEEIESLCKLLTTVGSILDTQKAHAHLDVYFRRMGELTKSQNVSPRMQFMLQDVIEMRERKWSTRKAIVAPTTIAQVHEAAAKEKAAHEKEYSQRQISMSRGGSRRGGDRSDQPPVNPDGWAVAGSAARPAKVDLSNFGKISNKQTPPTFGPGSIFTSKKDKRESISRTSSSSNMFSMLLNAESGADKSPEAQPQRKKITLLPRTKPIESEIQQPQESSEEEEVTTPAVEVTDDQAQKKIQEDLKEFFTVRNLDEGEVYFAALPAQHHSKLVDKLVSSAVESKEADAKLVADLFGRATSKNLCSQDALEQGFLPCAEIIGDIAIDAPKAFQLFAMMIKGAEFDEERRSRLVASSMDSDKLLGLLS